MDRPLSGWLQATKVRYAVWVYLILFITRSPRTILSRPERHPRQPILPSAFSISLTSSGSFAVRLVGIDRLLGRFRVSFLAPDFLAAFFVGMRFSFSDRQ